MTAAVQTRATQTRSLGRMLTAPMALLALAVLFCVVLLSLPITLTIGPMYWDVYIYYDAANRIFSGQVPIIDFFAPIGPLTYYIFAGMTVLFPNAQPSLLAPWTILPISIPLMALLVSDVAPRSRGTALALVIPFLFFTLVPFNSREFYPVIGSDAFGIYNRQSCQLLYVLVASFLFVRDARKLVALVALTMAATFFLKITGFVAGGLICAYALIAGRISIRAALAVAAIFLGIAALVELSSGLVSAYLFDIARLVSMNSGGLLSRFREALAVDFDIAFFTGSLCLVLAVIEFKSRFWSRADFGAAGIWGRINTIMNLPVGWLAAVLVTAIFFETQNTGSQGFIFLWPVLLLTVLKAPKLMGKPVLLGTVLVLVAAVALPTAINIFQRAARTYIGGLNNPDLPNTHLKTLGQVNARPEYLERAERMSVFYPSHRQTYDDLIAIGEYPTSIFFAEPHFQVLFLTEMDKAIEAMRKIEAERGIRFETIMSMGFVNPFPWLMDRTAPLAVSIGADPFRTVAEPGPKEFAAVSGSDIVLYPTCPVTLNSDKILKLYEPAIAADTRIALTPCYDAYINPRFAGKGAAN